MLNILNRSYIKKMEYNKYYDKTLVSNGSNGNRVYKVKRKLDEKVF